jgi:hypothetical protein
MYPKPDLRFFLKTTVGLACFLAILHVVPAAARWFHHIVWNEALIINERKFQAVLVVAYALAGISTAIHAAGLAWSTWHHRKQAAGAETEA